MPDNARISNKQIREVEALSQRFKRLRATTKFSLTEKEEALFDRYQRYEQNSNDFFKNLTTDD